MVASGRRHLEGDVQLVRRLPDSPVTAFAFGPTTVSVDVVPSNGILMGWSAVETTLVSATAFDIVDGADDTGSVLQPVILAAATSGQGHYTSWGLWIQRGVRVNVLSGSVRGVLY